MRDHLRARLDDVERVGECPRGGATDAAGQQRGGTRALIERSELRQLALARLLRRVAQSVSKPRVARIARQSWLARRASYRAKYAPMVGESRHAVAMVPRYSARSPSVRTICARNLDFARACGARADGRACARAGARLVGAVQRAGVEPRGARLHAALDHVGRHQRERLLAGGTEGGATYRAAGVNAARADEARARAWTSPA